MKKLISIIFLFIFYFNNIISQNMNEDWAKKNAVRFNFGTASLTRGDIIGSIFTFEYSRVMSKKITLSGKMSFINGSRPNFAFAYDTDVQFKRKNSLENVREQSEGLIILSENESISTHTNGAFLLNYTPVNKKRKNLSFSAGIGFGYISTIEVIEAYKVDYNFVGSSNKQRAAIFVPSYAKLLDITFPISMRYDYYFKKNWSFGGELGATFYSKYVGWYSYASFSVGVRFD
jgi:hypothetical protein